VLNDLECDEKRVEYALAQRWIWMEMFESFSQIGKPAENRTLYYAAARDMAAVLRFCTPVAVRMAAELDPAFGSNEELIKKISIITTGLLTAKLDEIPCIDDVLIDLTRDEDMAKAFTLFCVCFFCVVMLYVHSMPRIASTLAGTWPEAADKLLDVQMQLLLRDPAERREYLNPRLSEVAGNTAIVAPLLAASLGGYLDRMLPKFAAIVNDLKARLAPHMAAEKKTEQEENGGSDEPIRST